MAEPSVADMVRRFELLLRAVPPVKRDTRRVETVAVDGTVERRRRRALWSGVAAAAPAQDGSARRRAIDVAMSPVVVPLAVYLASYVTFVQHAPDVGQFLSLQGAMFHHQWHHSKVQVESSAPLSRQVVLVGDPLLWWGFLPPLPCSSTGGRCPPPAPGG